MKEGRAKRGRRIKKTKNGQVPKKKTQSARTAANKPKEKQAAAATPVKPTSIHVESSVKHVLPRTGKASNPTPPGSKAFKYTKEAEIPKMKQQAHLWLKTGGI